MAGWLVMESRATLLRSHGCRVWERDSSYNNAGEVAGSPLKSLVKMGYYHLLAVVYGAVGSCAQVRGAGGWVDELLACDMRSSSSSLASPPLAFPARAAPRW